jgi:hypothetical protein
VGVLALVTFALMSHNWPSTVCISALQQLNRLKNHFSGQETQTDTALDECYKSRNLVQVGRSQAAAAWIAVAVLP